MCPYVPKHIEGNTMAYDNMIEHNGLAWKDEQYGVVIIHTPKCASTTIRSHIMKGGPCNLNDFDEREDYKLLTVLRNPITRFFSGVTTALHSPAYDYYYEDNNYKVGEWREKIMFTLSEVKKGKYFNIHVVPQVWFHKDKEGNPFGVEDYLKFEDFENEIKRALSKDLMPVNSNANPIRETGIETLINDQEVLSEIRAAYAEDFKCYSEKIGEEI